MKNLIITILVLFGAVAGVCWYKGISPDELKERVRAEFERISKGRTPKEMASAAADSALAFFGETASALDDVIPSRSGLEDAKDSLFSLRERLKRREFDIMEANARLSPYLDEAVKAKRAYDRAVEQSSSLIASYGVTDPRVQKSHHDLAVLKDRLEAANGRHRKWKRDNASRLADPEKDAQIIELKRLIKELGGDL